MPLTPKPKPPVSVKLFSADAIELLKTLGASSVDLMIVDPAYESLEKHRKSGTTTRLKARWFPVVKNSYFIEYFKESFRVMKNNTHTYCFCDQETMFHIVPMATKAGFHFWKPIVWDKMAISTGYHWRNAYEFILFFEKGKRNLNNKSWCDIRHCKRLKGKQYYPTQKPVQLIHNLVLNSSNVGDIVLDPFMGAGSTGVASVQLGRSFIGSDTEADAVAEATLRIDKAR